MLKISVVSKEQILTSRLLLAIKDKGIMSADRMFTALGNTDENDISKAKTNLFVITDFVTPSPQTNILTLNPRPNLMPAQNHSRRANICNTENYFKITIPQQYLDTVAMLLFPNLIITFL